MDMFDNVKADMRRLSPSGGLALRSLVAGLLSQGFQAILFYRFFNWLHRTGIPSQPLRFICERFIEITTGISIPACCKIGKGLRIHHFGGIILHPATVIGDNCTLYHGVTIGDRGGSGGAATIGNNVLIGAGAKVLGEVRIDDNCVIGANAVVTRDVPAGYIATCSPCHIHKISQERSKPLVQDADRPCIPRIMELRGTYKGGGGPDKTILNSAAQHDKDKVYVLVTYIRQPHDHEFQIPIMAAQLGINYTELIDSRILDIRCLRGLLRLIHQHNIRVIHTHDDKTLLYAWLLKLIIPGTRLLHTCHSHAEYGRGDFPSLASWSKFKLRKWLVLFLIKRHHRPIVTISENTRQRLILGGLDPSEIFVLHNGIDTCTWNSKNAIPVLRKELGLRNGELLVGTVARITYDKDLSTFYDVARRVADRFPSARFVIVGDGFNDELTLAKANVERLQLSDRIFFTGHRNDLNNVFSSFDLFLMTSRTEGMPNTVLEAMALGLAVVSTNVGGVSELVADRHTGVLCPPGDSATLAEAVCHLLADEPLRRRYARASRLRVEQKFDFIHRVRAMEDIYAKFADSRCAPHLSITEIDALE